MKINNIRFDGHQIVLVWEGGHTEYIPYQDYSPPPFGNKKLEFDLNQPFYSNNTEFYANIKCTKCGEQRDCSEIAIKYNGTKFDRQVCKTCFATALDKMLGLDIVAETEGLLYEKK